MLSEHRTHLGFHCCEQAPWLRQFLWRKTFNRGWLMYRFRGSIYYHHVGERQHADRCGAREEAEGSSSWSTGSRRDCVTLADLEHIWPQSVPLWHTSSNKATALTMPLPMSSIQTHKSMGAIPIPTTTLIYPIWVAKWRCAFSFLQKVLDWPLSSL